jgi:hypothetical protein
MSPTDPLTLALYLAYVAALAWVFDGRRALQKADDMNQLNLLDEIEATKRRDAMLADLEEKHKGWRALAMAKFLEIRGDLPADFIGENIRKALIDAGLPEPRTPNAWGGFIRSLAEGGLIAETGEYRKMTADGSNARRSPVYVLAMAEAAE